MHIIIKIYILYYYLLNKFVENNKTYCLNSISRKLPIKICCKIKNDLPNKYLNKLFKNYIFLFPKKHSNFK